MSSSLSQTKNSLPWRVSKLPWRGSHCQYYMTAWIVRIALLVCGRTWWPKMTNTCMCPTSTGTVVWTLINWGFVRHYYSVKLLSENYTPYWLAKQCLLKWMALLIISHASKTNKPLSAPGGFCRHFAAVMPHRTRKNKIRSIRRIFVIILLSTKFQRFESRLHYIKLKTGKRWLPLLLDRSWV